MNSIPIELHLETQHESTHIETTIELQQGMCATYLLVSTSPHHELRIVIGRPAVIELARQLLQSNARP